MRKVRLLHFLISFTLLFLFLTLSITFGWFDRYHIFDVAIQTNEPEVSLEVYFVQDNETWLYPSIANELIDPNKNTLLVDVMNTQAVNYIGRMRVVLATTTNLSMYLRVKMFHELYRYMDRLDTGTQEIVTTGGIERTEPIEYIVSSIDWFDAIASDGYLYYKNPIFTDNIEEDILLIEGLDNTLERFPLSIAERPPGSNILEEGYILSISFKVEMVQATRYQALWDMTSLPWA